MGRPRGAALPETAVVLGLTLTLLYGVAELALIGYTQLGSDGAAYVAAHASALGNDPAGAIAKPFPEIARGSNLTIQQSPPDGDNVGVDYQMANQFARHGGVQVVRPSHTQATLAQAGVGLAGGAIGQVRVDSANIEANMVVSGPGFNVSGGSLNGAGNQLGYFQDDGNAPPYFIGLRFLTQCYAAKPNQGCTTANFAALGLAEYLDGDNWGRAQSGIANPYGVYAAMQIHQRVYARIAQNIANSVVPLDPANDPCLRTANGWDTTIIRGVPLGSKDIGKQTLNPMADPGTC